MDKKIEVPGKGTNRSNSRGKYAKSLALALTLAASSVSTTSCSPEHRANKKQRNEIKKEIRKINKELKGNSEGIESIRNEMQEYYNMYVKAATYYNNHIADLENKYARSYLLKTKKDALNAKKEYLELLDELQEETDTYFMHPNETSIDPTDLDVINNAIGNL